LRIQGCNHLIASPGITVRADQDKIFHTYGAIRMVAEPKRTDLRLPVNTSDGH
jgi:hypothetical protein